jgi:hypothetical protein
MKARLISSEETLPSEFYDLERNINTKDSISITLNRKKNFFSSSISGEKNSFALVSVDKNQIKAIASLNKISMSIGDFYTGEVGILSSVRSKENAAFVGLKAIAKCFESLSIDAIFTFVLEDNKKVIKMLEKRRKFFNIKKIGRFFTYIIPIGSFKCKIGKCDKLTISWANSASELILFYKAEKQDAISCPNLNNDILNGLLLKDFGIENFVTLRKDNKIIAMLAVCNQLKYRSWVATKYNNKTKVLRVFNNLFAYFTNRIKLPRINQEFKNLNLIYITCEKNNLDLLPYFLNEISKDPRVTCVAENFTICLHESNPIRSILKKFENQSLISKCFMLFSGSKPNKLESEIMNTNPSTSFQIEACIL